jgi:drug/metabolite transporter (DMT)-like permease
MVEAIVPGRRPVDTRVRTGVLMAASAAVLFAINGTISKIILLSGMSAPRLTELRSGGAFLVLAIGLLILRPERLRVSRQELPELAMYGVVGFALVQWFYFIAIERLPIGIALLLEFTAPILVALWARFGAHEHVRSRVWWALALSMVGLSFVAQVWGGREGIPLDRIGVIAGFLAAAALAYYLVLGEKKVRSDRDPISLVCWGLAFSALFWTLFLPWWSFPWGLLGEDASLLGRFASVEVPLWTLACWLILLGTIVPFVLIIGALQHVRATQAGVVGMLEPVLAALVAWWWLGEALGLGQVVGGLIVLVGIILAQTAR